MPQVEVKEMSAEDASEFIKYIQSRAQERQAVGTVYIVNTVCVSAVVIALIYALVACYSAKRRYDVIDRMQSSAKPALHAPSISDDD